MNFEPYIEFRTSALKIPIKTPIGEQIFIEINPGTSFGSTHQTTRLCIEAVEEIFKTKSIRNVLDFGCGSGILGISAAALGAETVLAIDIDPIAVDESIKNVERNALSSKIRVLQGSLERVEGKFELVIANIVTDELVRIVEGIKSLLREGGILLLSGISELKKEKAVSGFTEAGFSLKKEFIESGWVAIWFSLGKNT